MTQRIKKYAVTSFRAGHWLLAASVCGLIVTGIEIYNAAPFWSDALPNLTIGNLGLTNALRWHLLLLWSLAAALAILAFARLRNGDRITKLHPISLAGALREVKALAGLSLHHPSARYLNLQKVIYFSAYAGLCAMILTGFCLWKPVQLQTICDSIGGYEICRRLHFVGMISFSVFLAVHALMAILTPRALLAMLMGWLIVKEKDQ